MVGVLLSGPVDAAVLIDPVGRPVNYDKLVSLPDSSAGT